MAPMASKKKKLHKNVQVAFSRIYQSGGYICRQSSDAEEAMRGGGFIYFARDNNAPISPAAAKFIIENGLAQPVSDGLFADTSQSFRAVSPSEFDSFKERYETM